MIHLPASSSVTEQLHEALIKAFPFDHQIPQLSQFGIGLSLNSLVGETAGTSEKLFKLIKYADSQNQLPALVTKAREMNSRNELLRKAAGDVLVHEQIEAIVRQDPEMFPDPEVFRDRMAERERAVCRITFPISEIESCYGTGFLVGKDLVLTCFHVLEAVIKGQVSAEGVDIRFGYRVLKDKTKVPGDKFQLADQWLVASSPKEDLDFSLVRLAVAPEGKVLGTYTGAPQRRKIDLKQHREGKTKNTIIAIQHPQGAPLKVTFGSVIKTDEKKIAYDADTLGGSSGSPILLNDCRVTALHRQVFDGSSNAGIRISNIYAQLSKIEALSGEL